MSKRYSINTPRHNLGMQKPRESFADFEFHARRRAHADGSARLLAAIDALVDRTTETLTVPVEWSHAPRAFAQAYLGIEVSAPARMQAVGN